MKQKDIGKIDQKVKVLDKIVKMEDEFSKSNLLNIRQTQEEAVNLYTIYMQLQTLGVIKQGEYEFYS